MALRKHCFVYYCVIVGACFNVTILTWRKYATIFFSLSWQATDASSIKGFIPTAKPVQDSAFKFIISLKFVFLGAISPVQTNENHCGSKGCKEAGS
jgi:hypothetical protein